MPAAAVIPAPIGYIKVVAVKKLVVEVLESSLCLFRLGEQSSSGRALSPHCGPSLFVLAILFAEAERATPSLRANWSAQSRLYSFEHISLE